MRKIFHVILEATHLLNGIFQNVQERYTIHEVVEHPFFTNILYPDNRFFKPFQKQATVMDEERVCLFSQRSMKIIQLQKINKFKIFIVLIAYECVWKIYCTRMKFFNEDFLTKYEKSFPRICPHLLKKSLMEKFNFSKAVLAGIQCVIENMFLNKTISCLFHVDRTL